MEIKRYEMGPSGLVMIDVAANSIKNNLKPGAVLHWGGNMAWRAQDYAVIRREVSSFDGGVFYDLIALEGYAAQRVEAFSIKSETDPAVWHVQHFFMTDRVLSGDEVLDLLDRSRAKKLADEATANHKAAAFAAECDRLRGLANGLTRADATTGGCVLAAKNIRKELAQRFPGVKFSVRSKSYSGGNSVDVHWTDGPTSAQVDAILNKYEGGSFDGMTDSYTYARSSWTEVYGSTKYAHGSRDYSRAFVERVMREKGYADQVTIRGESSCWVEAADRSTEHWARQALSEAGI